MSEDISERITSFEKFIDKSPFFENKSLLFLAEHLRTSLPVDDIGLRVYGEKGSALQAVMKGTFQPDKGQFAYVSVVSYDFKGFDDALWAGLARGHAKAKDIEGKIEVRGTAESIILSRPSRCITINPEGRIYSLETLELNGRRADRGEWRQEDVTGNRKILSEFEDITKYIKDDFQAARTVQPAFRPRSKLSE